MTDTENIKTILARLEQLMHGPNYQAEYNVDIFDNCETLDKFHLQYRQMHEGKNIEKYTPTLIDKATFWDKLNFGLTYRGDRGAGLTLTPRQEEDLSITQSAFKDTIRQFISDKTRIYEYPEQTGIADCFVYWGHIFLLLNNDTPSTLIFGSASD